MVERFTNIYLGTMSSIQIINLINFQIMTTQIKKQVNACLTIIFIITFFLPNVLYAQDLQELYKQAISYQYKDNAKYRSELTKLAEKGLLMAQWDLARDYFNDSQNGNLTLSKKWFNRLKESDFPGVSKSLQEIAAIERLLSGGSKFTASEYKFLGDAYYFSNILIKKRDYKQAVFYYTKATSLGEPCYEEIVECFFWLEDYENVGLWAQKGIEYKKMDSDPFKRLYDLGKAFSSKNNYEKAKLCYLSAAAYGNHPKAYHELGVLYNLGKEGLGTGNVNRDNNYALNCFKKAYSLGCSESKWWIDQIQKNSYKSQNTNQHSSINYDNVFGAIIGGAIVVGSVALGAYAISEMTKGLFSTTTSPRSSSYAYSSNYSTYNNYSSSLRSKESKGSALVSR